MKGVVKIFIQGVKIFLQAIFFWAQFFWPRDFLRGDFFARGERWWSPRFNNTILFNYILYIYTISHMNIISLYHHVIHIYTIFIFVQYIIVIYCIDSSLRYTYTHCRIYHLTIVLKNKKFYDKNSVKKAVKKIPARRNHPPIYISIFYIIVYLYNTMSIKKFFHIF